MSGEEGELSQKVAKLTVKFIRALDKKSARHTTLERWGIGKLREWLHDIDTNDHYTPQMIRSKNKHQLIASILEEEGYTATINEYADPLGSLGINTELLEQISSFGV